jgi:uncharacterized protein YvpB
MTPSAPTTPTKVLPSPPTYSGPREVLVNRPVTLKGTYDASRIVRVMVSAEDRVLFKVSLSQGTWQAELTKGFSVAGARWLRMRGFDKAGKEVENRVFYVTVSTNPLTVGQALTLKVLQDTYFKVSSQDSAKLNSQQKILVKAGQVFNVNRYGLLDSHLKVELANEIAPIGGFGYFYEQHVQMSRGTQVLRFDIDDVPDQAADGLQLLISTTTFIKQNRRDSSELTNAQKYQLLQGENLAIRGYACLGGYFRVTLREAIPGFGTSGYIYWRHARLSRSGREVPYDPDALTAKVLQTTALKKLPQDAVKLKPDEKATVTAGQVYGVSSYSVESGHLKISATEEIPGFGNTGYIYPAYVQMRRGSRPVNPIPPQVELNVPYFSQRDNPRLSWATCNVTAIGMVMYYYGIRSKEGGQLEDELLQWCFDRHGYGSQTNHNVLEELIQAYGFKGTFSTKMTWQSIKEELINRRPVVLCGYFTHGGHIVTLIGFTPDGFVVNDPWGDGYYGYYSTEGRKLLYPYDYCNEMCGPDGEVWTHLIRRS